MAPYFCNVVNQTHEHLFMCVTVIVRAELLIMHASVFFFSLAKITKSPTFTTVIFFSFLFLCCVLRVVLCPLLSTLKIATLFLGPILVVCESVCLLSGRRKFGKVRAFRFFLSEIFSGLPLHLISIGCARARARVCVCVCVVCCVCVCVSVCLLPRKERNLEVARL